jgi:D-cysteine desulfhydrase
MSLLFTRFPRLRGRLPFRALGAFPTALEPLPGLCSPKVDLWVKREDQAGTLYGGNKVRKLELLLGDERIDERSDELPGRTGASPGKPRLLTLGAWGSNHALAVALYGQALGLRVDTVLFPQPLTAETAPYLQRQLAGQLGAEARLWPSQTLVGMVPMYLRAWLGEPGPVLTIPPGGSSAAGVLGWVAGGLEIAVQLTQMRQPPFDVVYVTVGTGGTAAGLWLGLGQAAKTLAAIRVVPWPVASELGVRMLTKKTQRLLQQLAGESLTPQPRLSVDGRYVGPGIGYGVVTDASRRAVERARACGMTLETTYTGKTLAALLDAADSGALDGKRVLFINTMSSVDLSALRARADLTKLPAWLGRSLAAPTPIRL